MKPLKNVSDFQKVLEQRPVGVLIGNFDGVHLGHQGLIEDVKKECENSGLELWVITFNPHPLVVLKNKKHFLLNSYEQRCDLLKEKGVHGVVEYNFTRDFSTLSPSEFLSSFILISPNVKKLFLGYDFAFGANKEGDHQFVKEYCREKSVDVMIQKKISSNKEEISSSRIREALSNGEALTAQELLGREFFLSGRVIKGAGRGRQIGFPTANIQISSELLIPKVGVYASNVIYKQGLYRSITNVGFNPTFTEDQEVSVETFIFDFDQDIYGEEIQVIFEKRIRDEKKFSSVNELIEQIKADCQMRKELL